jgi:hypothetical protein
LRIETPTWVAEHALVWHKRDGEVTVVARLGRPYRVEEQCWACPVALDGIDGRYPDHQGVSALQALTLAQRLLATRMLQLVDAGERFMQAGDENVWDRTVVEAIFGPGRGLGLVPGRP